MRVVSSFEVGLFIALSCSSQGCGAEARVFVQGPDPGPDEVLFWVSQRGGRLEWVRGDATQALSLDGADLERFFSVLLRGPDLERMSPKLDDQAIRDVSLRNRPNLECKGDFSVGQTNRRGFPLLEAAPEIRELDLEGWRFTPSPDADERLSDLAVDVPLSERCGRPQLRLSTFSIADSGRIVISTPVGETRLAAISSCGTLTLHEIGPPVRELSRSEVAFGETGSYIARALHLCPQDGRMMLYLADESEMPSPKIVSRLRRFDVTDGVLRDPELLDDVSILDLDDEAPSRCLGVGKQSLLVTSTSATDYRRSFDSGSGPTFESFERRPGPPSEHILAAGDGVVYRGRIDEGRISPGA